MPGINLLSTNQKSQPASLATMLPLLVKICVLILILMIGYYGFTWFRLSSAQKSVVQMQEQIAKERREISQNGVRNQVLTRQAQLTDLNKILGKHLYWSKFFDKDLPRITLKAASYSAIAVTSDGVVTLVVSVPTYGDLDKYLQVFDIADFNEDFRDVEIQSITRAQEGNSLLTSFKIRMKFDTESISYMKLKQEALKE
jgi:hypothetical protein